MPDEAAAESYRGHVGCVTVINPYGGGVVFFGLIPPGVSNREGHGAQERFGAPLPPAAPRDASQYVRCSNCKKAWNRTTEELAAGSYCPECQQPLGSHPGSARPLRRVRQVTDPPERELVRCEACGTMYRVDAHVVATAAQVQCTRCLHVFAAHRPGSTHRLPPSVPSALFDDEPLAEAPPPAPPVPPPLAAVEPGLSAPPFRPRRGFIGVTAARTGRHLQDHGRRLPIDVWLALADRLVTTLEAVPHHAPQFWSRWTGPHAFGVDLDGAFVAFDDSQQRTRLHEDWVHPTLRWSGDSEVLQRQRVWAVCRALVWLLDPFPTSMDAAHRREERVFEHPQVPPALHAVLDSGLGLTGPAELPALREAIRKAIDVKPASRERVKAVMLSVGCEVPEPDELPPALRNGGLQVQLDQLLEHAASLASFPADPRAVMSNPLAMPLRPTRTLELTMRTDGRPIRRVPVTASLGFPERIALPPGTLLLAGDRVQLELSHPEQRAFKVNLEATVGADGFATPLIDPRTKAELDVLQCSLDAEAVGPALVPPRPQPDWRQAGERFGNREPPGPAQRLETRSNRLVGPLLVLVLSFLLSLPIILVAGVLALLGVVTTKTLLWTSAITLGVVAALLVFSVRNHSAT